MLNTERRQPLEVMECLLHAIEYLRKPYSKLSSYSLPLLGLASHHCAALSQALDELIKLDVQVFSCFKPPKLA